MKKITGVLASLFILMIFTGCSQGETVSDKPQIYTSFYAIYDFTSEIAGDNADVHNVVPVGTEPHDWEPTAMNMAEMAEGDILFYNGLGMESWIEKAQASLEGENIKFVKVSEGVKTDENSGDPHIWLDPSNAEIMCENIYNALCEADPENSESYEANYNEYISQIETVDKSYRETLSDVPENKRNIVVSHEAYSYLCSAYGLEQVAVSGISADSEPSPDKMMELINFVKENNIKYIFYEELLSPKTAETLAEETGAQLLPLNPFEGLTEEEIAQGDNYISVMLRNLDNLNTALKGE